MAPPRKGSSYSPADLGRPLAGEKIELVGSKRCVDCREVKPKTEFHRRTAVPSGVQAACKICQLLRVKLTRNKASAAEYACVYQMSHRAQLNDYERYRYATNMAARAQRAAYMRVYRQRVRERRYRLRSLQAEAIGGD